MGILKDSVPRMIPGVVQRKRITLTSAQILALFTTPITIIDAPGAGKSISVDEVMALAPASGSVAYTGANAVEMRYTNASGAKVTGDLAAAWLNSVTGRVDKAIAAAVTAVVNAPVVICVPTANPGAGNGTITLDILYRVVSLS